ncbi:MAG: histidine phosphatase family protein [Chromatiales bacterium]|jgi:broad specificity phosphatase PhoE
MPTEIDLLRHGTPVGGNRYRGHNIDDPLSEQGWQQMWQAIDQRGPWDRILSSPMSRCREFAEAVADKFQIDLQIDERLKEVGFGEWEGKTAEQLLQQDADIFKRFYFDPVKHRPAGAEVLQEFRQRVDAALQAALQNFPQQRILLVAHAGVIRAAIANTIGANDAALYRLSIGNAAIVRLRDDGQRPLTVILK